MRATKSRETKARRHTRCPCCGRLALLPERATLPACIRADHSIDGMTQVSIGGGRGGGAGFEWTPRDLDPREHAALTAVVSKVAARLNGEEIGDTPAKGERAIGDMSAAELKAAHRAAIEREAEIARVRGVPALGEDVSPADIKSVRKKWQRDRELLRLAAEKLDALENENAQLRAALDDTDDDDDTDES